MSPITPTKKSRPFKLVMAALLGTTILAGGVAAGRSSSAQEAVPPAPQVMAQQAIMAPQAGFADLVAKIKPAVVNIATTEATPAASQERGPQGRMQLPPGIPPDSPFAEMLNQFSQQHRQQQPAQGARHALGSGFIVDPAGYIVTNNHVIDGSSKIMVTLDDGTSYPAKIQGRDEKTDLALLKIDAPQPLPSVAFGSSGHARVGDWVVAVGNPFGLGGTVTAGIVSAHGRNIDAGPYDDFLQIDAAINPGNSGGPVFDQSGHVIGIDTAIYSPSGGSVGIGFAIPSDLATKVVAQLREHGSVERGWLGVQMQPLTKPLATAIGLPNADGVLVDQVEDGSPAKAAHLKQGDVVTAFNGSPIKNARDLAVAVADTHQGDTAKLTVWRDGNAQTISVSVAGQKPEKTASADPASSAAPVGLGLARLSPQLKDRLGLDADATGAVVAQVQPDSKADQSGFHAGDVIVKIGSDAVTNPAEVTARIRAAQEAKKTAVPVLVMRDHATYYLALELGKA